MMTIRVLGGAVVGLLLFLVGSVALGQEGELQGRSLLGRELHANTEDPGGENASAIAAAERTLAADPDSRDAQIELGIALARSWRYREAIEQYDRVIATHPDYAYTYRLRGHRYISLREFDRAVADLARAAELDQSDFDIWYHLGLAHYLRGEFEQAARAYRSCLETVDDDDGLVAVSHWLYMSLRRAGQATAAAQVLEPIREGMAVSENGSYYDLLRFYKGDLPERQVIDVETASPLDLATAGYGVANWHLYNSDGDRAFSLLEKIVSGPYWPAFGFIAAEAELSRLKAGP